MGCIMEFAETVVLENHVKLGTALSCRWKILDGRHVVFGTFWCLSPIIFIF